MEKLIIGDYTFDLSFFGVADMGNIQLIIKDSSLVEIATAFSAGATSMTLVHGDEQTEYRGYSVVQVIAPTETGIRVSVRRKYVGE